MPKIRQLSAHVADLIAAGEVVERPASVAKELVENAIDAGAKNITVEIQNGGMTLLRVQDDGCGIAPEDAETAFLRHATSKLRSAEDLESIGTLGFRGEALAATAAVSRIDLLTRTAEHAEGLRLRLEGGVVLEREQIGCPVGTTLLVRDLFFNTPARMKFMKQDSAEGAAVFAAVQKQALAHPECAIRFLADGEEKLHTPGDGKLESAIYTVLGRKTALEMAPVDSRWESVRVQGFVTRPTATRGNRNYEIFFVNGRWIRSKALSAALEEAYRGQIMVGRFPACVLCLELPLSQVDVNVHPAKTEVKFLREKEIFDCVHYGVLGALQKLSGRVAAELPKRPEPAPAAERRVQPAPETTFRKLDAAGYRELLSTLEHKPKAAPDPALTRAVLRPELHSHVAVPEPALPPVPQPAAPAPEPLREPEPEPLPLPEASAFRIVGEVLNTYIIVEQDQTVLFIDKHAAHERILFESLLAQGVEVAGQLLLAPMTCVLHPEESAALTENKTLLASLGYDFDDLGDGTLLLRQVPADLDPEDAAASLSEIAEHLSGGLRDTPETLRERLLQTVACKAAIKGGWHTDPLERERLVRQVLGRDDLKYCPHGRPICITLSRRELEKQFKRAT